MAKNYVLKEIDLATALGCTRGELWQLEAGFENWAVSGFTSPLYKLGQELYNTYV